jgi:hypothetical protein
MKEFKSRKFLLTLIGIGVLTCAFFATSKLDAGNFVLGICGLIGAYITGNAVVSFKKGG